MANYVKPKSFPPKDYKERFEFKITVGNNIICQRYIRIPEFNPTCLKSIEFAEAIRDCGVMVDDELKSKTLTYASMTSPQFFDSVEEMNKFFSKPQNRERMSVGEGIVIRKDGVPNYYVSLDKLPVPLAEPFYNINSPYNSIIESQDYKIAFYLDEKEVVSYVWNGRYPKQISGSIDLSNRRCRKDGENLFSLSFEEYLSHKIVEGRGDLMFTIMTYIAESASQPNSWYTTSYKVGGLNYKNEYSVEELKKWNRSQNKE